MDISWWNGRLDQEKLARHIDRCADVEYHETMHVRQCNDDVHRV
jgi:hypothetical protein